MFKNIWTVFIRDRDLPESLKKAHFMAVSFKKKPP